MHARGIRWIVSALLVAVGLASAPTAAAVTVPPHFAASQAMSPASDARAASTAAQSLRKEVAALLQQYIDKYRSRFSDSEIQQLLGYRSNADRQLGTVVLSANRVSYLTSTSAAPAQRKVAASRAMSAWTRAKATAETSWDEASRIMEPKLSLLEKLGAANDYNSMMGRFDALGDQLRAIARQQS